jgi:hypothetical protein
MSRSTRTITAGIAAFAALAPAAVAMPTDGPIRTSSLAGTHTTPATVDHRSPDARDAAQHRYLGQGNTAHATLRSAHVALPPVSPSGRPTPVVHVAATDGFDWTDAVIGAGGAFGGLVLVAGTGALLRRRTIRHSLA